MTRPPARRAAAALAIWALWSSTAAGYTAGSPRVLLRLAGLVDELVGVPADGLVEEHLLVVVGRVAQDIALALEHEARGSHLLLDDRGVDPVQGIGVAHAGARLGDVVD